MNPRYSNYLGMPVLVTGGAGFIGSHLVRALLHARANVMVLDDFSHGSMDNLADIESRVGIIQGDIRQPADCLRALTGRTIVFHLAALGSVPRSVAEPLLYNQVNIGGTLNLLETARQTGVRRFIYSASSSAYGDTPITPKSETLCPNPLSPYAITKLTGEYFMRAYASLHGLQTLSLRYFNVFGPRQNPQSQYAAVIPAWIHALLQKQPPTVYGDGAQTRDFCYVDNVVHANLLAGITENHIRGEVVNIACGESISLTTLGQQLQQLMASDIQLIYQPPRPGDVRDSLADITLAKKMLDYEPLIRFHEGLAHTVKWYQNALKRTSQ